MRSGRANTFLLWHAQAAAFLSASVATAKRVLYLRRTVTGEPTRVNPAQRHSAKSLWHFEHLDVGHGAVLSWDSTVRIRQTATGRYLAVVPIALTGTDDAALFDATLVDMPSAETTFQLHSIVCATADRRILLDDCAVRIEHRFGPATGDQQPRTASGRPVASCWLHFDGELKPRRPGAPPRPDSDQVPGQTPPSWQLLFSEKMCSEDPVDLFPVETEDVRDVLTSLAFQPVARRYADAIANMRRGDAGGAGDAAFSEPPEDIERAALAMLVKCVKFHTNVAADDAAAGGGSGDDGDADALVTINDLQGPPILRRQNFSRELKLLDALFAMVQAPVSAGVPLARLAEWPTLARVQRAAFKALTHVVEDNRRSELYFATHTTGSGTDNNGGCEGGERDRTSWVNATIFQVCDVPQAAQCLNTILSNNLMLVDKYVDMATIDKFTELISTQGPHQRFMKFFHAICSCNGKPIISNQELCLTRLFLDPAKRKRLILVTRSNDAELALPLPRGAKQKWTSLSDQRRGSVPEDHRKFIGMEQWREGFDPIFIKWECRMDWRSGLDEIFFHPRALDMDHYERAASAGIATNGAADRSARAAAADGVWVPIEKLCWVLDPVKLFATVMTHDGAGGTPMQSAGSANAAPLGKAWWALSANNLATGGRPDPELNNGASLQSFEAQRQLALYYETQIDLFAEMCFGRSYNAINELCKEFSYPALVSLVANDWLPDQIRASFTMLLLSLYIDRFPHERLPTPSHIQVLATIERPDLEKSSALPQYHVDPQGPLRHYDDPIFSFGVDPSENAADKFHLIEEFISDYMYKLEGCQVAKDKEKNIFTLALLSVLEKLVAFGFYGTRSEIVDLCNPMIAVLDGRADKIDFGDRPGILKRYDHSSSRVRSHNRPSSLSRHRYRFGH